jgi:hypothetical protein
VTLEGNSLRGRVAALAVAVALTAAVAGVGAEPAHAQGGAPAPDFSEPCPALYPGDDAVRERIARWMARGAADRGLPHELPVMAAIAESGLRNIRGTSYHGFFGMHESLSIGEYRGFPSNPELQLEWFLDTAMLVRQRLLARGRPDPAASSSSFGEWIADVERPAPQNRSAYQPHLAEARGLVAGKCAAPHSDDATAPRLVARLASPQRPSATGGIVVRVRCPDDDCLAGATASLPVPRGDLPSVMRARPVEPPPRGLATLVIRLPRVVRRRLARGESVRTTVTTLAADLSGNLTQRARLVRLTG